MKKVMGKLIFAIPLLLIVIVLIYVFTGSSSDENIITGIVEGTTVDVASKIPGRVDSLLVKKGDFVSKGTIIARLESKELDAKIEQARGAMMAASAKLTLVNKGAREEEKRAVKNLYNQTKEQYDYSLKTWTRLKKLYEEKVISNQEWDEMQFKYNAAREQMEAAKAKLDMVNNGARPEEKEAVAALAHQAENAYNEAMAYYQELSLKAPVDGEITNVIIDAGEIVAGGYPVISMIRKNEEYVVLQLREDLLKNIKMGTVLTGFVPALDRDVEFKVKYISAMADFATWRPTNQKGEFDLKTFEVHLVPTEKTDDLRPGMTAQIKLKDE